MRISRSPDVSRSPDASPLVGAAFPVLLRLEDRKDFLEAPASRTVPFPAIVVAGHAARPNHGVDRAAAAQHMPKRHVEFAIV